MASFVDSHCSAVLLSRRRVSHHVYVQSLRELLVMECVVTSHRSLVFIPVIHIEDHRAIIGDDNHLSE